MDATAEQKLIQKLTTITGVEFKQEQYFREALTHRSYINEARHAKLQHNERLEFLGDAVLELSTTEFLFHKFPERPEGDLTSFRAALVRTESLAAEALNLGLGELIYMSRGEESTGGRERPYILANTFEAVLGAIFLDQGFSAADKFVHAVLLPKIDHIVTNRSDIDAKSKLQELTQDVYKLTPGYKLLSEAGPDHDKTFEMAVMVGDLQLGQGSGKSKQDAEQMAAKSTLQNWDKLYQKHQESVKITPSPNGQ